MIAVMAAVMIAVMAAVVIVVMEVVMIAVMAAVMIVVMEVVMIAVMIAVMMIRVMSPPVVVSQYPQLFLQVPVCHCLCVRLFCETRANLQSICRR